MTHSSIIPPAGAQRHLTPALMLSDTAPEERAAGVSADRRPRHRGQTCASCGSLLLRAPPRWCRAWRLHLDTVGRAISVLSHQAPAITAGVMHPLTELLVGDIQFTVTVWARDYHALLDLRSATHVVHRYRARRMIAADA